MSRQLHIVFEQPERRFEPGDEIKGQVVVVVEKDTRCKGLKVTQQWQTHGKGNTTRGVPTEQLLFEGEWTPGKYHYPFVFTAPLWPFTYHGDYLNVDWYIKATADVPWAFDPSSEEEFLLRWPENGVPEGQVNRALVIASFGREVIQSNRGSLLGLFAGGIALFGTVFLVIGLVTGIFEFFFFTGITYLFATVLVFAMIKIKMASSKVGDVELSLDPSPAYPGASVVARMAFTPQSDAQINAITATIKGQEVVVRGSGTNRTTYRNTVHEETISLHPGGLVPRGEPIDVTGVFAIGEGAPLSFEASDNELSWDITYHIDIARWPDWRESKSFVINPPPEKQSKSW